MKACHLLPLALCACAAPEGHTLLVAPGAGGEWDDPAAVLASLPFTTIQAAVDAASPGDTVLVPSGTYYETFHLADGVAVQGAGREETILIGRVLSESVTGASLSRMTIEDEVYVTSGALYGTSSGVFVNGGEVEISDLEVRWFRWGVLGYQADLVVFDGVRASENQYGIVVQDNRDFTVSNCLVTANIAGGIASTGNTSGLIVHNTVVGNAFSASSDPGAAGIGVFGNDGALVADNVVTSNWAGMSCDETSDASWSHNLVWGNTTDYVNEASAADGDLSVDPEFVASPEGDYHLRASSLCIDAGASTTYVTVDVDGEARPQGAAVDLGFDEYTVSVYDLVISEVMANAAVESTGEFVELYNAGTAAVDLAGLILTDGDDIDTLEAFGSGSTVVAAGEYAVVVDPEYSGAYGIDSAVTVVTTGDTTIGNGLTTSDHVSLFEADGATVIATMSHPRDPGDGVSLERVDLETADVSGNWRDSQCTSGSSPGAAHCFPDAGDPSDLVLTEIMCNPLDEATGEYLELFNNSTDADIDLAGLVIEDGGGYRDVLEPYLGGSTLLGPGEYALVIDSDYAFDYLLPTEIVLVTTGDSALGNGLSLTDNIAVYDTDGSTLIDSYSFASGGTRDGTSAERIDYDDTDHRYNWRNGTDCCSEGRSPGRLNGAAGGICEPLLITEVMANPLDEDTGEFIELYHAGDRVFDLAGMVISDGVHEDTLTSYDGGITELDPGQYAVIVDAEFAGEYTFASDVVVVTTEDTHLGNGLSVSDEVRLYEDGHLIDAYAYPTNPGNGFSVERTEYSGLLDWSGSWLASTCPTGASPGEDNCSASTTTAEESTHELIITEVMANPLDESTGEFVEIYNKGTTDVDLYLFVVFDGDAADTIQGFSDPYDTVLGAGQYAVILDSSYDGAAYSIPSGVLWLTTDDAAIGSGLSTNDEVYLYEDNGASLIDSYAWPRDPGNGQSVERVDYEAGDLFDNWADSTCASGSSPGQDNCAS